MNKPSTLVATVALLAINGKVAADDVDAFMQRHAQRLAVGVCGTCHGAHGVSSVASYPRLAGQNERYLAAQLRAFRAETRGDPDAIAYMWGMAGNLDDATIDALAAYYAKQQPAPGRGADSPLVTRGKAIYEHGIEGKGVPACAACHGLAGRAAAESPRLAGQQAQYVLKQLTSFRSNMRNDAVMHGVCLNLRLPEIQAVAAYLEAQR